MLVSLFGKELLTSTGGVGRENDAEAFLVA